MGGPRCPASICDCFIETNPLDPIGLHPEQFAVATPEGWFVPPPLEPVWIWVSLSYATFGLAVQAGQVVDAAPIARWTIGKTEVEVADYYRRRGATFVRLRD